MKKCQECMWDAPYNYCCKVECHEHMFCEGCQAESKMVTNTCPHEEQEEEE